MNFQKRKQKILALIKDEGEVEIKKLALELQTSEITTRRDLNQLAQDGLLYRTYGGAMKLDPLVTPHDFVNKAAVNHEIKDDICRIAADQIMDGDIIFMDCGSTVFRLCQFIKHKNIRVITNSIPVVYELQNSQASINIIGGEFDAQRQAVHGEIANEHIAKYRATKAFLGVDGISPNGLFANSEKEASITLALAAQSLSTYILCDTSKIGKESYLKFAELNAIDTIITNQENDVLELYRAKGVRVLTPKTFTGQ